jgi:hypothetical protein
MLRHYVENVLPRGLKAQVVAVSRKAAVRYQEALSRELRELIEKLEKLPPNLLDLPAEVQAELTPEEQFLTRLHPHLDALRRIAIAAVISGEQNDPAGWKEWTDPAKTEQRVGEKGWFKMPLVADDPDKQHGLAILCVKSMLLTGFDAPVEQALYLDRPMKGAELLQAIARVNRIYPGKGCGLIVDYCGVAKNLSEALALYSRTDREGVMRRLLDDLPTLEDRHRDVMDVFRDQGLDFYKQRAECVDLLADIKTRAEFTVKLRLFLEALDMLLPRPEGLPFTRDARQLGLINMQASNRYRDGQLNVRGGRAEGGGADRPVRPGQGDRPEGAADFHPRRASTLSLDGWRELIDRRIAEGCRNAAELHRDLVERGCSASYEALRRFFGRRLVAAGRQRQRVSAATSSPPPLSARRLSFEFLRLEADRTVEERSRLEKVRRLGAELREGLELAEQFAALVRKQGTTPLESWLSRAEQGSCSELRNFARGLRQDEAAVAAALREPWSNGPVEGHINRLKAIKRQMNGRAGLPLLRARVLAAA